MPLDTRFLIALAGAGSAGLLIAALMFQAAGYAPCDLCILQRWPHLVAALIAAATWFLHLPRRLMAVLGAATAMVAVGLAFYHTGVEQKWWPGPADCTGAGNIRTMSVQDLVAQIQAAPVVRCDDIAFSLFGVSMAGWNALASSVLVAIWLLAVLRRD